jgi:hypothetical protein
MYGWLLVGLIHPLTLVKPKGGIRRSKESFDAVPVGATPWLLMLMSAGAYAFRKKLTTAQNQHKISTKPR